MTPLKKGHLATGTTEFLSFSLVFSLRALRQNWFLQWTHTMEIVTNSKGQIVIPSDIRRQLGIKKGTFLHLDVNAATRQIILTPITREYIHSLRGKYKGKGLMKVLLDEKRVEKNVTS